MGTIFPTPEDGHLAPLNPNPHCATGDMGNT
jgi:hypothetical protein